MLENGLTFTVLEDLRSIALTVLNNEQFDDEDKDQIIETIQEFKNQMNQLK